MDNKEDILSKILDSISVGKPNLFNDWGKIVNEDLSKHSKILDIDKGIVKVAVSHSGWKNMLQIECRSLIFKINKMYPDLKIKRIVGVVLPGEFVKTTHVKKINDKYLVDDPYEKKKKENWDLNRVENEEFRDFLKNLRKRGEDENSES